MTRIAMLSVHTCPDSEGGNAPLPNLPPNLRGGCPRSNQQALLERKP